MAVKPRTKVEDAKGSVDYFGHTGLGRESARNSGHVMSARSCARMLGAEVGESSTVDIAEGF
jgi:hypothetical protein